MTLAEGTMTRQVETDPPHSGRLAGHDGVPEALGKREPVIGKILEDSALQPDAIRHWAASPRSKSPGSGAWCRSWTPYRRRSQRPRWCRMPGESEPGTVNQR